MKEKIIDFSNGIFSYDQVRLTTEPERIEIELDPGKGVKGDLIVSSQDERRVKGMIFSPDARADFSEVLVLWKSRKAGIYVLCRASAAGRDLYRISLDRIQCGRI